MMSQKRTRTDGQLSREQYDALGNASSSATQSASTGFQVADGDTLKSRKLSRTGDAKMRALNKSFNEAVKQTLAGDANADLSNMITDYLSYSNRIQQSYLANPGQVFTCGNGDCGQLGFGTEEFKDMEVKVPRLLTGIANEKVILVACGGISNAALTQGGRVFTWGSSDDGGLGRLSGPDAPEQKPGQVTVGLEGTTIMGVASGDCHTVALDVSGRVYGWGCYKDKEGKQWFQPPAGAPTKTAKSSSKSPVVILGLPSDVVEVKCGASFCLALTQKGDVYSWGLGEIGELGRNVCKMKFPPVEGSDDEPGYDFAGILRDHLTPGGMYKESTTVGAISERMEGVKAIGCGDYHSLVVALEEGDVYTCGLNSYGQLGLGDEKDRTRLALVEELAGLNTMATAGGAQHSLVLTMEGLFAFGRNDSGQLGCLEKLSKDDWGSSINVPTEVYLPPDAGCPCKIECGTYHCLVVTDKHELYTWGFGGECALGHGNEDDLSLPKKVDLSKRKIKKVLTADGGAQHSAIVGITEENDQD